jgi:DNA-binding transcriptional ArsR family regulator
MDAALRAIADPIRRQILSLVWREERTAGEIAARFEVSQPAISQHLKVLRETGLVAVRRDGARRFYRTDHASMARVRAVVEAFWDDRLAVLKAEAEALQRRRDTDAS